MCSECVDRLLYTTDLPVSQFRSVLDSLVFGGEETLPFSAVPYAQVYRDLTYQLSIDTGHSLQGKEVSDNIQALISDVRF